MQRSSANLAATIILPTTGNRAAVLRHSIPSILAQTERSIEVFVIGDGAAEETRQFMSNVCAADSRVVFVNNPKHPRRGEPYRHDVLQQARGRIVCYLCDRDLMRANHVAHMGKLLEAHDFAHSARVKIAADGSLHPFQFIDLSQKHDRLRVRDARIAGAGVPLSCTAHTLAAYKKLSEGWSRTPAAYFTDVAMWWKFLKQREIAAVSDNKTVTILYFPRYPKKEWPTERRAKELVRWSEAMEDPDWQAKFDDNVARAIASMSLTTRKTSQAGLVGHAKRWYSLRKRACVKIAAHYLRNKWYTP